MPPEISTKLGMASDTAPTAAEWLPSLPTFKSVSLPVGGRERRGKGLKASHASRHEHSPSMPQFKCRRLDCAQGVAVIQDKAVLLHLIETLENALRSEALPEAEGRHLPPCLAEEQHNPARVDLSLRTQKVDKVDYSRSLLRLDCQKDQQRPTCGWRFWGYAMCLDSVRLRLWTPFASSWKFFAEARLQRPWKSSVSVFCL